MHGEPLQGDCYKVGSRGPCPLGQLVVFERYSGKSFRGECGCSEGYNQNYWQETGQCYEWYSQVSAATKHSTYSGLHRQHLLKLKQLIMTYDELCT